jgi:acyl carrier protein phosphodiesterase
MNYLAHALLSPDNTHVLMGNLWGDLIKPKDYSSLHPGVLDGVMRHRQIDAYTDQHPAVEIMISQLRPHQGKYAPVVADVLMDFMLSKYWKNYNEESLEKFCQKKYQTVKRNLDLIPERVHPRIIRMVENQWLESCKNTNRMNRTFFMLSKRAAFENKIEIAMQAYHLHETEMNKLFLGFFDDLQKHINLQNEG